MSARRKTRPATGPIQIWQCASCRRQNRHDECIVHRSDCRWYHEQSTENSLPGLCTDPRRITQVRTWAEGEIAVRIDGRLVRFFLSDADDEEGAS